MHEAIEKYKELLKKDLKEELINGANSGSLSPDNIHTVNEAFDLLLDMDKYEKCEMYGDGYLHDEGYSTRRGRSMTTGRYVSRDMYPMNSSYDMMYDNGSSSNGYSGMRSYGGDPYYNGYSGHEPTMTDSLQTMYRNAKTDQERQMISGWMRSAEMNR